MGIIKKWINSQKETILNELGNPKSIADLYNLNVEKEYKSEGVKTKHEYEENSNCDILIFCQPTMNIRGMVDFVKDKKGNAKIENTSCLFVDRNQNTVYKTEYYTNLYNVEGDLVGTVDEIMFAFGDLSNFEYAVRKCKLLINNQIITTVKKAKSFGELEISATNSYHVYKNKKGYKIKYKRNDLAEIFILPPIYNDGYFDRFLLKIYDKSNEPLCALVLMSLVKMGVDE